MGADYREVFPGRPSSSGSHRDAGTGCHSAERSSWLRDHEGYDRKRADGAYEPELADLFVAHAESLLSGLDDPVDRETILALEPLPHAVLDEDACEDAYLAIADMIDMSMPFTFGHSRAVSALADAAGKRLALPASDIREVRWAAYTHDIGELAIPVSTWMRRGAFTERETDAARLHPYHGERALASWAGMARRLRVWCCAITSVSMAAATIATPAARPVTGRPVLAAAEAFQTAREARPYRGALSDAAAAARLRGAVKDGKLCPEAVEAVLTCAGQPGAGPRPSAWRGYAARDRGPAADRGRAYRQGSGPPAGDRAQDRRQPYPEPLFQDRRHNPGRRRPLRSRAWPGAAGNIRGIGNPPMCRSAFHAPFKHRAASPVAAQKGQAVITGSSAIRIVPGDRAAMPQSFSALTRL